MTVHGRAGRRHPANPFRRPLLGWPTCHDVSPYDALLLVSFGGPERPEDVVPFLENVTRGRGIPRERLEVVGEHYQLFGGRSPINDLNRDLLAAVRADLAGAGIDLPGLLGQPQLGPLPHRRARRDARRRRHPGRLLRHQRLLVVVELPAVPREPVRRGRAAGRRRAAARQAAPLLQPPRASWSRWSTRVVEALTELPDAGRPGAHLVFVTHSIPIGMNERERARRWRLRARSTSTSPPRSPRGSPRRPGTPTTHALVYCSRSGPPSVPWLEPDVNDHLTRLAADGVPGVVLVPVGFVSDHMEVVYDLDTEALETARELQLPAVRAATPAGRPAVRGDGPRAAARAGGRRARRAGGRGRASGRSGRCGTPARSAAAPTRPATGRPCAGPTRDAPTATLLARRGRRGPGRRRARPGDGRRARSPWRPPSPATSTW